MTERARRWASGHAPVLIYLAMAAVVFLALGLYQRHVNAELNRVDEISCENRATLISNQKLVLDILYRNVSNLAADALLRERTRDYFVAAQSRILRAEIALAQTPRPRCR